MINQHEEERRVESSSTTTRQKELITHTHTHTHTHTQGKHYVSSIESNVDLSLSQKCVLVALDRILGRQRFGGEERKGAHEGGMEAEGRSKATKTISVAPLRRMRQGTFIPRGLFEPLPLCASSLGRRQGGRRARSRWSRQPRGQRRPLISSWQFLMTTQETRKSLKQRVQTSAHQLHRNPDHLVGWPHRSTRLRRPA